VVTVIVGLGKTGMSCVRYFQRCHPERSLRVVDSREHCSAAAAFQAEYPSIPLHCGAFTEACFENAQRVIVSPGVQQWAEKIREWVGPTVPVTGDLDVFADGIAGKGIVTVGVTGSNGKSTVTTLVGEILKAQGKQVALGGNLGTPALDLLPTEGEAWPRIIVLELSSFQLAITQTLPLTVATVLNLSPDHLDYHGSEAQYLAAKCRIFQIARRMVVNREASNILPHLPTAIPSISFGLSMPENMHDFGLIKDASEDTWLCQGTVRLLKMKDLKISGTHNAANVLAAFALTASLSEKSADIDWYPAVQAVTAFEGLSHRCQWVREIGGVQWINDSKGTNVGATEQALLGLGDSIAGKWILLAGGDGKGADFNALLKPMQQCVKAVVLIGKDKKIMEAAFKNAVPCHLCTTLEEAVLTCHRLTQPGDGVLLSPACASIDMFADYEERGNLFMQYVKDLSTTR
jgi:UDP-N-acetylmuramoylalanine--D-glutamate ligase